MGWLYIELGQQREELRRGTSSAARQVERDTLLQRDTFAALGIADDPLVPQRWSWQTS
jgi:hypothetical protein